ncbi:hypothetical protein BaRGS_00021823, partial [Batillaria attramentaria]
TKELVGRVVSPLSLQSSERHLSDSFLFNPLPAAISPDCAPCWRSSEQSRSAPTGGTTTQGREVLPSFQSDKGFLGLQVEEACVVVGVQRTVRTRAGPAKGRLEPCPTPPTKEAAHSAGTSIQVLPIKPVVTGIVVSVKNATHSNQLFDSFSSFSTPSFTLAGSSRSSYLTQSGALWGKALLTRISQEFCHYRFFTWILVLVDGWRSGSPGKGSTGSLIFGPTMKKLLMWNSRNIVPRPAEIEEQGKRQRNFFSLKKCGRERVETGTRRKRSGGESFQAPSGHFRHVQQRTLGQPFLGRVSTEVREGVHYEWYSTARPLTQLAPSRMTSAGYVNELKGGFPNHHGTNAFGYKTSQPPGTLLRPPIFFPLEGRTPNFGGYTAEARYR